MDVLLLVAGILVVVAVALAVVFGGMLLVLRRVASKKRDSAHRRYPDARHIDVGPNSFGQKSRGKAQVRGNGTLILTDSELIFEQWVPSREFRIPLRAIRSVETPKSFLGKTQGVPLLEVGYLNEAGEVDSMAWRVAELSEWMRKLDETSARIDRGSG